jgi:hypothetical protein
VTTIAGKYCYVTGISNTDPKPSASCYADGNGTVAGICRTKGDIISSHIAVSKTGDKLFFTDYGNNVVRKIQCTYQAMNMIYGECFHPTLSPTLAPSEFLTIAPSETAVAPMIAPTGVPTASPTSTSPSTLVPTKLPTQSPSSSSQSSQSPQYIAYPFAPNALYQPWMNVSFVSGRLGFFAETAGFHSSGVYNGVLGITFDKTETYGFLTSADGKKVRKLDLQTTQVGLDVTSKIHSYLLHKPT